MGDERDNIYVGYLPMPTRHKLRLRAVVPVLIGVTIGLAVWFGFTLVTPGNGVWTTTETVEIRGIVRESPYPHLETDEGPVLLVEVGKHGASERVLEQEGKQATATGTTLTRGQWRTLEVQSLEYESADVAPNSAFTERTQITATGEIVDSKCYLGAMKPGDGRTHRSCAILCIRGGIAPVFVGRTETGEAVAAVVTDSEGHPMTESMLEYVGLPITLSGKLGKQGSLSVLRVDEDAVHKSQ